MLECKGQRNTISDVRYQYTCNLTCILEALWPRFFFFPFGDKQNVRRIAQGNQ